MFLLDLLMIVWAYASNRWLYEIVRHALFITFQIENDEWSGTVEQEKKIYDQLRKIST